MLEEAIVSLLLRHNCVVVPAFGGFVAQSSGANIDMQTGIISPPRKSVLFNRQLVNNDGLLINYLSTYAGWTYADSDAFVGEKVSAWHESLKKGERVVIDKIGHLFLDAERNISFEQDRYFNLLLQSYGLNKVHFITEEEVKMTEAQLVPEKIHVETGRIFPQSDSREVDIQLEHPVLAEEKAKIIPLQLEKNNGKTWKYLAAAALLPIAFYTFWIPVKTNVLESGMISIKDFNPNYQAGSGIYQQTPFVFPIETERQESLKMTLERLPEGTEVYLYKYDEELTIPVRLTKDNLVQAKSTLPAKAVETNEEKLNEGKEATIPKVIEKKAAVARKELHYITGCFSNRENAEAMVKILRERGLNGKILDVKNGMTRVSAGGAENEVEFQKIVAKAQAIGYRGWKLD